GGPPVDHGGPMRFAFSEEQEMLRATARRFLNDKAPTTVVRRLMETDAGFDTGLWAEIAAQGWQAMAVPEEFGGAGYGIVEQGILMEEMGRTLFPAPFLSAVVLGADLILRLGTAEQRKELLPDVASGERRPALAQLEASGRWGSEGIVMTVPRSGGDLILTGTKSFVIDGHTADTLLVVVRAEGSIGADGVSVVVVDATAPGISRGRVETMDMTRKQAEVRFDQVRVPRSAILGEEGSAWPILDEVNIRAAVALAFEQVGGAERCLEMAVTYAKDRVQFGRPIGSFQAIKHKCADMLVRVEGAKSAAYHAGWAAAADDPDLAVAAPLAKSYCSEAYFFCAAESIQVHGGIGFTWEHDAHLYLKRAKTDELLFGTPAQHRERLAVQLGF
ncbi:MAG TPA: acyl-CoA dehydrogenase family protein, partial [Acidimicrobiia bacterium]|nr:acyl-CoA dehydrogenase family protein [Acidimicrobiia bacterium]